MKKIITIFVITLFLSSNAILYAMPQTNNNSKTYWYDNSANSVVIPDVYYFSDMHLLSSNVKNNINNPSDMFITSSNLIYILDGDIGNILCLDKQYNVIDYIDKFTTSKGEDIKFNKPEGIFIGEDGMIFIADTGNKRIVKIDNKGKVISIFGKPKNIIGLQKDAEFFPTKLIVDKAGRMYVISRNINMGLLELDSEGSFISFFGAPTVTPDFFTLFWRRFSTKEQKAQLNEFVPTEYGNVLIDKKDFIYATIPTIKGEDLAATIAARDLSGKVAAIRKLNSAGDDILRRKGAFAPVGDLEFSEMKTSKIVDVSLGQFGTYSLLDAERGRVFTYDNDGNLLFVFGDKSEKKGAFSDPVAIGYIGNQIFVLDNKLGAVMSYTATDYGSKLLQALYYRYQGDYASSFELWNEIAQFSSNYRYAYISFGKAKFEADQYSSAMEKFKYAGSVKDYSLAFEALRKEEMSKYFKYIFLGILLIGLFFIIKGVVNRITDYVKGR